MQVYLGDKLPDVAKKQLAGLGCDVIDRPDSGKADLDRGIGDAVVLVVRSTVVSSECIRNSPALTLIIRAGAGVNNIDQDAASKAGIFVSNCPGQNAIAVAELALGLMLSLDRRLPENVAEFRNGNWKKSEFSKADGLYGKKLGIIGTGQIGREVIARAGAFGMPVIAWSRSLTAEKAEALDVTFADSPGAVAAECDILSVHLALSDETRGLISADILASLKQGALFINTSRAEVVDGEALYRELESGRIRAGLDVFDEEPEQKSGPFSSRLQKLENVYVTHHIGASTQQAQIAVAMDAVETVRVYVQEGRVRNWLNKSGRNKTPCKLVVRHFDKPGVLANVMSELKAVGINAQELENVIFKGKETACCTIQLNNHPPEETLTAIRGRKDEVISALLLSN
ncbi:NAD(P)-dependent oxidoreductase [Balneolales bacterium ANBcel1]|nr:NAD(P)-dependent oxidoreductase [Balneolales bacterium ANBcel1]